MQALLQCLSHTPLKGYVDPAASVIAETADVIARMADELKRFDPELIFLFSPDHYNGFFLDNMPQLCIGMNATSVGDYRTTAGPLDVPADIAERCAQYVMDQEFDVAVSYRMKVDHGFAQPMEELTGGLTSYPVIPIFINGVAPPVISCARARKFGEAVGRFAASLNKRVLFIASGGLSHNPPIPKLGTAPPELVELIVAGRNPTPETRNARQARTIDAATRFSAGPCELHPLNAGWDQTFMRNLVEKNWSAIDAYKNEEITADAGGSTHESKTWVAATAAMNAACNGRYRSASRYYREIPEWIAGFGVISGESL